MPTVLVTVGTDHHPFDRLVDWVDAWAEARGDVRLVVQHGASRPSRRGDNLALVPRARMLALIAEADAVVAQGGPGSILDARRCGRVPVVVARRAALGEVVDDHQVAFCTVMADEGMATVAGDAAQLAAALDRVLDDPPRGRCDVPVSPAAATAEAVRREITAAIAAGPGFVRWRRLGHLRIRRARRRRAG